MRSLHGCPQVPDAGSDGLILRLEPPAPAPVPWWGARTLLALLRRQVGARVVDQALVPHRALLSLVLRGLELQLNRDERGRAVSASANFLGALPNPQLHPEPLAEAWAEVIDRILTGVDATIVLADAVRLDAESVRLIRPLLRRAGPRGGRRFIVGIDCSWAPQSRYERVRLALLNHECRALAALAGTDQVMAPESAPAGAGRPYDCLDDRLEESAWDDPKALGLNVQATRAAFGSFAFAEALEFASRLLQVDPRGGHAAEMHAIAGVCARNLGIPALRQEMAALSQHHFEAALAREKEPSRRVSLLCRVAAQRSAADPAAARKLADAALAHARERVDPSVEAFFEAWALHARALTLYQSEEFDDAAADCELAIVLLRANPSRLTLPPEEKLLSIWFLYENLTRIALRAGWRERAVRYRRLAGECAQRLEPDDRLRRSAFAAETVANGLAGAARRFEERLREAQERLSPHDEEFWQRALGQIYYRLGAAEKSLRAFEAALEIRRRIDSEFPDVTSELLHSALAALRARRGAEADAYLTELSGRPGMESAAIAAEILAARGLAAVLDGHTLLGRAMLHEAEAKGLQAGDALGAGLAAQAAIERRKRDSQAEALRRSLRQAADALAADDPEVWRNLSGLAEAMAQYQAPPEEEDTGAWSSPWREEAILANPRR